MVKINVTVDSEALRQIAYRLPHFFGAGKVAPNTKSAFDNAKGAVREVWQGWAMGSPRLPLGIPDIRRPSSTLAGSIKSRNLGPFDAEVYSESAHARRIQDGTAELDMKTTHPYGKKSRVSEEGFPYLIVPFRWGTPNDQEKGRAHFTNFIPATIFSSKIKKLETSKRLAEYDKEGNITGGETHFEENYAGDDIERSDYAWGDRYKEGGGNMKGMARMANSGGYFTFRIISAKQLVTRPYGWIKKAVPPVDVAGAVAEATRPYVEDVIRAGIEADIGV
ncbi:MAG: hypothetical protein LBT33_08185 [Spirochaetia bacterium]|nr:hypothetical protein [Spirochaetia bacterium]